MENQRKGKLYENNLANEITNGEFQNLNDMVSKSDHSNIFELILAPTLQSEQREPDKAKKRNRKKHL